MNGMAGMTGMDEQDTPIEAAWERIENWLMENGPMTLLTLNGGATDKDFWAAEAALGFPLPAELRESYRIHNGQAEGVLMDDAQFLSLADMASAWQRRTASTALWKPNWLPLTTDEAGNHACFDTKSGQIIFFLHDENTTGRVAASFTHWLQNFADALEAGQYEWSSDTDGLMRRRDEPEKEETKPYAVS